MRVAVPQLTNIWTIINRCSFSYCWIFDINCVFANIFHLGLAFSYSGYGPSQKEVFILMSSSLLISFIHHTFGAASKTSSLYPRSPGFFSDFILQEFYNTALHLGPWSILSYFCEGCKICNYIRVSVCISVCAVVPVCQSSIILPLLFAVDQLMVFFRSIFRLCTSTDVQYLCLSSILYNTIE